MGNLYIKDNILIDFEMIVSTIKRTVNRETSLNCPNCGREILVYDPTACKYCGWPLIAGDSKSFVKRKIFGWILKISGFFVIILGILFYEKYLNIPYSTVWSILVFVVGIFVLNLGIAIGNGKNLFTFSKNDIKTIPRVLYVALTFSIISSVLLIYFLQSAANKSSTNFDLATYCATIGSLVMVGGFIDRANERQASMLINIGKWFLIASISSAIFSLCWNAFIGEKSDSGGYWTLFISVLVALTISAYSFTSAVSLLIPTIFKLGTTKK